MAKKKTIQDIQTGRNLPPKYRAYSPTRLVSKLPQTIAADQHEARPRRWKRVLAAVLVLTLVVFLGLAAFVAAWDARNISAAEKKLFGTGNILELINTAPFKGSETGRVNLLLVGYSVDDPGHPAAKLTDSLLLLSMSTTSPTGYMLSIPRDLYVKIPDYGYAKINEAYQNGGINTLEQIISRDFGVNINYYALINYTAVRQTVDALGGITVNIHSSDPRGLYDPNISRREGGPLKLANGPQELDGQTALNFTRARGDAYGAYGFPQADFDRTAHQRQVLTAIKQKVDWKLVLDPRQNSRLLNAVAQNVRTDIAANEIRSLFNTFNNVPADKLRSVSLRELNGRNYLTNYTTAYGQSALIPAAGLSDYSDIQSAVSQLNR